MEIAVIVCHMNLCGRAPLGREGVEGLSEGCSH